MTTFIKPSIVSKIVTSHYQPDTVLPIWLKGVLECLSVAYSIGLWLRDRAFAWGLIKTVLPTTAVVSIGNLTTGGTGKTPVILAMARQALERGLKVVILSRGYGAKHPQEYARATHPDYGDEACMLQKALPGAVVIVGKNRVASYRRCIQEFQPDLVMLDDGFQHRQLGRTLNICLIDAQTGLGNGKLLPAGPLREPISALGRADWIWLTKTTQAPQPQLEQMGLADYCQSKLVESVPFSCQGWYFLSDQTTLNSPQRLRGTVGLMLCAIAQPAAFYRDLTDLGVRLEQRFEFRDHECFSQALIQPVLEQLDAMPQGLLFITEKDRDKLLNVLPKAYFHKTVVVHNAVALPQQWFSWLAYFM
jgi:tetraacyldisaccharide 4'-kinase